MNKDPIVEAELESFCGTSTIWVTSFGLTVELFVFERFDVTLTMFSVTTSLHYVIMVDTGFCCVTRGLRCKVL